MTQDEINHVLDAYWDDTSKFDPWTNGKMEAELAPFDPNADGLSLEERKAIIAKRSAICDRYQLTHDWMVGQRMAIQMLRGRFAEVALAPA